MGGTSSQVLWNLPWERDAENSFWDALNAIGCSHRELASQQWDGRSAAIGGVRDYLTSYMAPASASWSSVLLHLNSSIGESLATELSKRLSTSAIVLFEYDEATWGYSLFERGQKHHRFWSMPEAVEADPHACRADVQAISRIFGVSPDSIGRYLRHVTDEDVNTKAFPEDEFTLGDHWVRCDFIRRLGLRYPDPGQTAGGRHVQIFEETGIAEIQPEDIPEGGNRMAAGGKPWWKFW